MPSVPSNEFRLTPPTPGQSPDEALHAPLLADAGGAVISEIRAFKRGVALGIAPEAMGEHACGPKAKAVLVASGVLKS